MKLSKSQRERERQQQQVTEQARMQREAVEKLTAPALIELLAGHDYTLVMAATDALAQRGNAVLDDLVQGLQHKHRRVRRTCALLLDHSADDRCVEPLLHTLRHDPLEAVRRCAMHSLACQNCKECPLHADIVGALTHSALHDRSLHVRRRAVQYLVGQKCDARAVTAMQTLLHQETDAILLRRAERALQWHQA